MLKPALVQSHVLQCSAYLHQSSAQAWILVVFVADKAAQKLTAGSHLHAVQAVHAVHAVHAGTKIVVP